MTKEFDYLLVGGGIVSAHAAEGIRELDKTGTIGIISSEKDKPYTRPALTKKLWTDEEFTVEDVVFDTIEETNATFIPNTTVTSIDKENKTVTTNHDVTYTYKKLLLATGGEPQSIEGPEDDRVFAFRTLENYNNLRSLAGKGKHAIVVGGSYIGTELAANLKLNDTDVTFIYPQEMLSGNRFPEELAREYENTYREHGITLMSGTRAESYSKKGDKLVVQLDNGETVEGDMLVLGLGVDPRLSLAEEAGLEVDDGVIADEYLRTSDPNIYAAGDIVSYPDTILGRTRIEHVDHARQSGTQVGKIMAGSNDPYTHTPYFYSDVFDISWEAIGTLDPKLDYMIDRVDGGKVVYFLENDKPVGVITWNIETDLDEVREVLKTQPPSSELKGRIRDTSDEEE
ncbi:FAD-dependent oxidoreductase [Alkalibacterium iburiense]|uniref:FAD-dependent oxidoreductase n=1 Tax=Alkalibacterium iburiense TaxID=290589 RepID=A0ABP3HEB8_9LACT